MKITTDRWARTKAGSKLIALFSALASINPLFCTAQLTAPPATTQTGGTFSTVVITATGNLTGDGLKVNPVGGQTAAKATATLPSTATGVLTNTQVNMGGNGGVTGLDANGTGATITLGTGSTISETNGGGDTGAVAENGGTVNLTSTSIQMVGGGGNSPAIARTGGIVTIDGSVVSVSGGGGNGLQASGASQITATNSQIKVTGFGGNFGVQATNSGTKVTLNNTSVTVDQSTGGGGWGVQLQNGANLQANGASITSLAGGGGTVGLQATGGSTATLSNSSIKGSGPGTGGGDIGLQVTGSGSAVTLLNTSVEGSGSGGGNTAVSVSSSGSVIGTGGSILASGTGGDTGLSVTSANATFIKTTLTTTGPGDTGVLMQGNATVSMTGGSVETQGSAGQAIFVTGNDTNTGTFDGTSVKSDNGNGILAQGGAFSTLNFLNGATLVGGNGTLLLDQAGGTVNLNGTTNIKFIGDINATGAGGVANVTLKDNSTLTGAINRNMLTGASGIDPADPFPFQNLPKQNVNLTVDSTSTWTMTASSTLNTLAVSRGAQIIFTPPPGDPFKTLVMNNLQGSEGIFRMNNDLAAIKGDLVAILHSSEGVHLVTFNNLTPGSDLPANVALLVVKTPDGGAGFVGEEDGGTFRYFVVHGDGSSVTPVTNNWYLVRGDELTPGEVTPTPPTNPNPPTVPPSPPVPPLLPPGIEPEGPISEILDLTAAANAAIGTFAATMPLFYADVDTLVQRMGELRLLEQAPPPATTTTSYTKEGKEVVTPAPPAAPPAGGGVWLRGFGSGYHLNDQVSRTFDMQLGGFQVGADKRLVTRYGDLYLGGFAGYFYAHRDFQNQPFSDATGTTQAFSLGAYGTLIHPSGFYADLVLKYTQLWNDFNAPNILSFLGIGNPGTANYSIPTFGASLELGKRWDFGHFFVEPQGQIEGAWADGTSYTVSTGLHVNADSQYSLRGRLGVRAGYHFDCGKMAFEPYGKVSVVNEFLGGYTVQTDFNNFAPTLSGVGVDAAAGLTARITDSIYIYGEYDYFNSDKLRSPWAVNAGLRWQW
jgi:outer membrane autotransporter protein